jgi:hypothetical protein
MVIPDIEKLQTWKLGGTRFDMFHMNSVSDLPGQGQSQSQLIAKGAEEGPAL